MAQVVFSRDRQDNFLEFIGKLSELCVLWCRKFANKMKPPFLILHNFCCHFEYMRLMFLHFEFITLKSGGDQSALI